MLSFSRLTYKHFKYGALACVVVNIILSILIYQLTNHHAKQEIINGARGVTETIEFGGELPNNHPTCNSRIVDLNVELNGSFKDTVLFNPEELKKEVYWEYSFTKHIKGKNYLISYRHWKQNFIEVFSRVTLVLLLSIVVVFVVLYLLNKSGRKQFVNSLNENKKALSNFNFASSTKLQLKPTGIGEFDEFSDVLGNLSVKLVNDYKRSAEQSANIAHELQTPLAIIRNKCENLFSNTELPGEVVESIHDIYISSERLSSTIKGILLLNKIENHHYKTNEEILINEIIEENLDYLKELIQDKALGTELEIKEECCFIMNRNLANLWIQNVILNAIKYSEKGKTICIKVAKNVIQISNYGEKEIERPEKIFNRFYKEGGQADSTGIGLAIVKRISDFYNIQIAYSFITSMHIFSFELPEN